MAVCNPGSNFVLSTPLWKHTTPMRFNEELTADGGTSQPTMTSKAKRSDLLSKHYAEYSPYEQSQIQKIRLRFLRDCKTLKRPPPSLRINGASALSDPEKLVLFSQLETQLLEIAINNKVIEVKALVESSPEL